MLGLRDEITRTFLRLRNRNAERPSTDEAETVLKPDGREGTELGGYRILKRLGSGGMGLVYLALDTRLGRHVALKFLPPELTADPEMLLRLEQEARATSALNHPNIVTIYEIVRLGTDVCIASEFVDGATLRTAIARRAVGQENAIDIACQVASALIAAHAAGVVHCDLKPGNIMIRDDGYVKVIDFGLAKYTESGGRPESARSITRPGNIVGTVDYMSPEQARGEHVDHRTDLWSLGVVLYEMVSNRLPFEGPTDSHVMVGILDHPAARLPQVKALPPGLVPLIERALAKDRNKRYRSATELLSDLQAIHVGAHRSSQIRLPHPVRPATSRKLVVSAFVLSVFALVASGAWWRSRTPAWFQIGSVRQMTDNGRALLAAISPDGRYIAYVAGDLSGQETLILRQVDSPAEEVKIAPRKIAYIGLAFSPDGQSIFESEKDDTMVGKLYSVPLLGSRPDVPILTGIDGSVTFSPSGDRFAFVNRSDNGRGGNAIEIAGRNGSGRRKLIFFRDWTVLRHVAWSPERDEIAAFLFNDSPGGNDVGILDLITVNSGHENRRPMPGWRLIGQLAWTADAKGLILPVATRTEANNQVQIREIAVRSGEVRDVTKDLARYQSLTVSTNRDSLAAVKLESRASLWISSGTSFTKGRSVFAEAEDAPTLAWTDPDHIAVHSKRTGFPNLMLVDVLNLARTSLTDEPFLEQGAAAVPGSKWIVMASNRSGQFHIWKFNPDTNEYVQLTFGPEYDQTPSVSPDGRLVVCAAWPGPHLRVVPVSGGPTSDLGTFQAKDPVYSPDGRFLACQRRDLNTNRWTTAVFPVDQPDRFRSFPSVQSPVRWLPGGKALASIVTDGGVSNIWAMPLDGSPARKLTSFDDQAISTFAFSPRATAWRVFGRAKAPM